MKWICLLLTWIKLNPIKDNQKQKGWLWCSESLQVHDDEGLLARCALSETHIQTAGRGSRSLPGHDVQSGRFSSPHMQRLSRNVCFWKQNIDIPFSFCAYRSIWSSRCLWTNTPPATPTPAAPPVPPARTLSSPTTLEPRSRACQSFLPTPTGQPSRNADTSSLHLNIDISSAPCLVG